MTRRAFDEGRRTWLTTAAALALGAVETRRAAAADEVEIVMSGTASGSEVWFRPRGLAVRRGQTVRWVNGDTGNAHTTTAYHPANGKPLRIPEGAKPWNSGYLLPKQSFAVAFDVPGVYDFFCIPHELAGMVGRIVVGEVAPTTHPYADTDSKLPPIALSRFPTVADIVKNRTVD